MPAEILIDARPLQGASAVRGIGTYVRHLLQALAAANGRERLAVLLDSAAPEPQLPTGVQTRWVRRRYHGRLATYEDAVALAADLDRVRPALFHATTLRLPGRAPCPVVVTVHDLIPWSWGGPRMAGEQVRYLPGKRLLRRAEAVIAVSECSAADAIVHASVARERVTVVPEGVGADFSVDGQAAERVATRWGLHGEFLLYVGALDRRKDPVGLVRAWRTARRLGVEAELVIAGDPGRQAPGRMGGARVLGHVTDPELADLYRAALCLVFPSRYEGFGLPVLEAMACGCPVIAYDNSAVAEVGAGVARLVRDGDAPALGREIATLAADPDLRREVVTAGLERARPFTWERTARGTLAVYRALLR